MKDIYSYNMFDRNEVIDDINNIASELEEERSKSPSERDRNKEFNLIYRQFIKGLKLSTRNNF